MRYSHILQQLYGSPLLITPQGHAAIAHLVQSRLGQSALKPRAEREAEDICGDAVEVPQMRIEGGLAIIPISGIIGSGLSKIEKGYGAVGAEDIQAELKQCAEDPGVKAIILDCDSPGGMVAGTPETADLIADLYSVKPVYAYSAGQICSACYWLAAPARKIFCTQTADIGSIGVYVAFYDERQAYEDAGIFARVFKSGKFKGMGTPGTSLTKEQSDLLQDRVNSIADKFKSHVVSFRGAIDPEVMQGQSFMGEDAVKNGLADKLVSSLDDVKAYALSH